MFAVAAIGWHMEFMPNDGAATTGFLKERHHGQYYA